MTNEEKQAGVHSKEKTQTNPNKTTAEQYAEHHKLDYSKCDGKTWVEGAKKKSIVLS
jgi:hypothetical protein